MPISTTTIGSGTAETGVTTDVANLQTLTGRPDGSTHLGTFTGTTIADSSSVVTALQAIETAHEGAVADITNLQTLTGRPDGSTHLSTFTSKYGASALVSADQTVKASTQQVIDRLEEMGGLNVLKFGGANDGSADTSAALVAAHEAAYTFSGNYLVNPTASAVVTGLTRSGTTATVTVAAGGLANVTNGDYVTISGASPAGWNGTYIVTVTSSTTATFTVDGSLGAWDSSSPTTLREQHGSSIFRKMPPFVFFPPGEYRFDAAAVLDSPSAQTINIIGYGAVLFQGISFPTGRHLIEAGKPTTSTVAGGVTSNQPFFVTIKGLTFRDFDHALHLGYASANVNVGRMQVIDCDFIGKPGGASTAIRAFNRSASLQLVRCQFDCLRTALEVQSVDRVYVDDARMQIKEYMPAANRNTLEGRFVLRRGAMYVNKATLNPSLEIPEDPIVKPMGWFLAQEWPEWQTGVTYKRGDMVYYDGGEGNIAVASIALSGSTVTVTTSVAHGLTDGDKATIAGVTQSAYNGEFVVAVDLNNSPATKFTYTVSGSPSPTGSSITVRRQQLWVCKTGDASASTSGQHTSAAAFSTDKATHWLQVGREVEGPLSVWGDITIRDSLLGGEAGGVNPIIWDLRPDHGAYETTTVTYGRTAKIVDCLIGSVSGTGENRTNLAATISLYPTLTLTAVDTANDTITVPGHTFANGDGVRFTAVGSIGGVNTTTQYYVINVAGNVFGVSATHGGAAVDLTGSLGASPRIARTSLTVSSITHDSGLQVATYTTAANHGMSTGDKVIIAGATQTEYNGEFTITRTGDATFTCPVAGSPASPATGTITALTAYVKSASTTATVKTLTAHGLKSGQKIVIAGATQTEYNGTFAITRINDKEFTYTFAGSGTSPATGVITGSSYLGTSPTVLLVQIPNRLEVVNNKYSFTQQVAADYWIAQASQPTPWLTTRFKTLEARCEHNYGTAHANHFVAGGTWADLGPNYAPADIIAPVYNLTPSTNGMYVPNGAKLVTADTGTSGTPHSIFRFFGTSNGQEFTLLVNQYTTVFHDNGATAYIRLANSENFNPGATGATGAMSGSISFVMRNGTAHETSRNIFRSFQPTAGTGITGGTGTVYRASIERSGGLAITRIFIDLTGLSSGATADDIIGKAATANCHLGLISSSTSSPMGTLVSGRLFVLETPAGGDTDIDLFDNTSATRVQDDTIEAGTWGLLLDAGTWTAGDVKILTALPQDGRYLYLAGQTPTQGAYTAGQAMIELIGTI